MEAFFFPRKHHLVFLILFCNWRLCAGTMPSRDPRVTALSVVRRNRLLVAALRPTLLFSPFVNWVFSAFVIWVSFSTTDVLGTCQSCCSLQAASHRWKAHHSLPQRFFLSSAGIHLLRTTLLSGKPADSRS